MYRVHESLVLLGVVPVHGTKKLDLPAHLFTFLFPFYVFEYIRPILFYIPFPSSYLLAHSVS